jgi:hypothetical protein
MTKVQTILRSLIAFYKRKLHSIPCPISLRESCIQIITIQALPNGYFKRIALTLARAWGQLMSAT